MIRYLLDTNILSEAVKPIPSHSLTQWLAQQEDRRLFIGSFTLAEIQRRILEKPAGKKRRELEAWFSSPTGPPALFAGRILPFDDNAAMIWATLMSAGVKSGKPRSALDMIVAATALATACVIVTANTKDFHGLEMHGLEVLNPLRPSLS